MFSVDEILFQFPLLAWQSYCFWSSNFVHYGGLQMPLREQFVLKMAEPSSFEKLSTHKFQEGNQSLQ